ncbi:MAG TPA: DUF6064 family protein [Gemmatimonadaceae bacterium]|nr:DUF6064 family protein [Gemmatimonadaceae bacterium]
MRVPFTVEQFLDVFRQYNEGVWPAQWGLLALGLMAVVLAFRGSARLQRTVSGILGALWFWMGLVYHLGYFRAINPAALIFAILFVTQAALFIWLGVIQRRLAFRAHPDVHGVLGALFVAYALVGYPILGVALGHRYPAAPTFGLPCPTTILTFGLLLWATMPVPRALLVIPVLWTAIATSAALQLGMREDLGLLVAGVVGTVGVLIRDRSARSRGTIMTRTHREST